MQAEQNAIIEHALVQDLQRIAGAGIERVRVSWCDLPGALRGKAVVAQAVRPAVVQGRHPGCAGHAAWAALSAGDRPS